MFAMKDLGIQILDNWSNDLVILRLIVTSPCLWISVKNMQIKVGIDNKRQYLKHLYYLNNTIQVTVA